MATILYGKPVRERMIEEMKARVAGLGFSPCLAILQVGEREDSTAYIKQKQKFGEQIGVKVILKQWKLAGQSHPPGVAQTGLRGDENPITKEVSGEELEEKIIEEIKRLNLDKNVNGIIVQLPLPEGLDTDKILRAVLVNKDADGLAPLPLTNNGGAEGWISVVPATARAIMGILKFYEVDLKGKKVAVIGRSKLVGKPVAECLRREGADVEVCHRGTIDAASICRTKDLIVVAAGHPKLVTKDFVHKNQIVIDVGINRVISPTLEGEPEKPRLVGDVDFEEVEPIVAMITPVPGGVGPVTVACLFQNLLDLCYNGSESF